MSLWNVLVLALIAAHMCMRSQRFHTREREDGVQETFCRLSERTIWDFLKLETSTLGIQYGTG